MRILSLIILSCTAAAFGSGTCCYRDLTQPPMPVRGPEFTGNYAQPYLYSHDTGQTYADPKFYYAQRVVEQWNRRTTKRVTLEK